MEHSSGFFLDQDWESLSRMFTFKEGQFDNWSFENLSSPWPICDQNINKNVNECQYASSDAFISNFHTFSQEIENDSNGFLSHNQSLESSSTIDPMVFSTSEDNSNVSSVTYFPEDYMGEVLASMNGNGQLKRKFTMPPLMNFSQDMSSIESVSKKKPWVLVETQKISKKNKKSMSNSDHDESGSTIAQNRFSRGDNTTACRRAKSGATNSQSVYARKRRETINEKLKTLQKLVPSGTKVDISTMLEETVHYVKFLQLQIKLLSSDETWMYSPIAYNGMDSGLTL